MFYRSYIFYIFKLFLSSSFSFWFVLILIVACLVIEFFFVLHFPFRVVLILAATYLLAAFLFFRFANILTTYLFNLYFRLSLLHTFFQCIYLCCLDWCWHFWWSRLFIITRRTFTFLISFSWPCLIWWPSLFILS